MISKGRKERTERGTGKKAGRREEKEERQAGRRETKI